MTIKPHLGFTYDCPNCFDSVSSSLDIFMLRAAHQHIYCDCKKSKLDAYIEDNVLVIKYPCALCGQTHEASFLPERALSGNMCCLECRQSGLPTGYVSTPDKIEYLDSSESNEQICALIMNLLGMKNDTAVRENKKEFNLAQCSCGCNSFSAMYNEPYLRISCLNCGKITEVISKKPIT